MTYLNTEKKNMKKKKFYSIGPWSIGELTVWAMVRGRGFESRL